MPDAPVQEIWAWLIMTGIPFPHGIAPIGFTVLSFRRILGLCKNPHGPVKRAVPTVVVVITDPEIDDTRPHPHTQIYALIDVGNGHPSSFIS
jgi:hypothetical protein